MNNAITFLWEDIFINYDDFKAFTDTLELYAVDDAAAELFNQFCYKVLARRYTSNNINFTVIDAFKMEFANVYTQFFAEFKKQKELVDASYSLSLSELEIINEAINNSANNPNTAPTNAWAALPYISNQISSQVKSNKLAAYIAALRQLPMLNIKEFIKNFEYLFMFYIMDFTEIYN